MMGFFNCPGLGAKPSFAGTPADFVRRSPLRRAKAEREELEPFLSFLTESYFKILLYSFYMQFLVWENKAK